MAFMHELPIRKVPGIGRVNERLLEAIGVKASLHTFWQSDGFSYSRDARLVAISINTELSFLLWISTLVSFLC
jgi:hypothetical protein